MTLPFLIPIAPILVASSYPDVKADQRYPAVGKLGELKSCEIDRVMIGPDSFQFAAWENDSNSATGERAMLPPSTIVFGRFPRGDDGNKVESATLSGSGLRLYPIRWSPTGGQLYIRIREKRGRIIAISPEGKIEHERQLPEVWQKLDIASTKYGDLSDLESAQLTASLQRFVGPELIRGNVTFGDEPSIIGVQSSDLSLVRVERERIRRLHLAAGWTRNVIAFAHGKSSYPGGVSYLGAARTGRLEYRPYQRPIVDLSSGKVVGVFNPTTVFLDSDSKRNLEFSIDDFLNKYPGKIILDASLNGNALMVLIREPNGSRLLLRADPSSVHELHVCRDPLNIKSGKPTGADLAVSRISSGLQFSGRKGDPVVVKASTKSGKPNEVIVYIHGGPGGTLADELWQLRANRLVQPGRDLVAIEYSGSVGGGKDLSRQLATGGMKALTQDAGKLARWLKKRKYSKIYIVAGSFGSILGQLFFKSHNNMVDGIFHIAPLIKLQNPAEWAPRYGLNAVNSDTQLAFERTMFGGDSKRSRFVADVAELWSSVDLDARTNFYFGDLDRISQPSHINRPGASHITTIAYTNHALVGATSEVWADIEDRINQESRISKSLGSESKDSFWNSRAGTADAQKTPDRSRPPQPHRPPPDAADPAVEGERVRAGLPGDLAFS